eukprot:TRINITY_DN35270_c0_g1_i1.p1 TRINITY_DN35270_c0_g1~~TRINITY_DN35270_c0_g1_i1.p1  ORF type:complete len:567 (+),score=225.42 TRINITY_DN35270_c0_g1_i1:37-1701(+)
MAALRVADTTPVLVGVARYTHKILNKDLSDALTPLQLMEVATKRALSDAGLRGSDIDCVATISHMHVFLVPPSTPPHYPNPPKSLANRIGASRAVESNQLFLHPVGGNGPQELVNILGEKIAKGELRSAVVSGSEALAAFKKARAAGIGLPGVKEITDMSGRTIKMEGTAKVLPWGDEPGGEPRSLSKNKTLVTRTVMQHGLAATTNAYALFEQAYRKERYPHMSREAYQKEISRLMSEFSAIAAQDPENAWVAEEKSAEEIGTAVRSNRIVAYPYTRMMNSFIDVDQSGAVVLMSVGEARRLGVPEEKLVYLHAHADAAEEEWDMLMRPSFTISPALRAIREQMERTLGSPLSSLKHKEIYSCFPVAVRHAALELGLPFLHASDLCKTGGMHFHGGPGNSFTLHSIACMVEILRKDRGAKGLVTANGGFFSKHSAGVYSTEPHAWVPRTAEADRARAKAILAECYPEKVRLSKAPSGEGTVDVWTVEFSIHGPKRAIAIGTLSATKERFVAVSSDEAVMRTLLAKDTFSLPCRVTSEKGKNKFELLDITASKL